MTRRRRPGEPGRITATGTFDSATTIRVVREPLTWTVTIGPEMLTANAVDTSNDVYFRVTSGMNHHQFRTASTRITENLIFSIQQNESNPIETDRPNILLSYNPNTMSLIQLTEPPALPNRERNFEKEFLEFINHDGCIFEECPLYKKSCHDLNFSCDEDVLKGFQLWKQWKLEQEPATDNEDDDFIIRRIAVE